jgi:hypothetical protein
MAGQPTKYHTEIGIKICEQIACSSKSMKTICDEVGVKYGTHLEWIRSNNEYSRLYARAKEDQADLLAEEIIQIADDGSNDTYIDDEGKVKTDYDVIARSKLRIDARKFIASKLKPKKYGDKLDLTSDGDALPSPTIILNRE